MTVTLKVYSLLECDAMYPVSSLHEERDAAIFREEKSCILKIEAAHIPEWFLMFLQNMLLEIRVPHPPPSIQEPVTLIRAPDSIGHYSNTSVLRNGRHTRVILQGSSTSVFEDSIPLSKHVDGP
jgi:hypothetical protein